ncbi:MAG: DUF11 domain-containing protein [Thermoflexales bacterium]|nr:DUF11 domain-containing protein [Thermoflexales bacterium]
MRRAIIIAVFVSVFTLSALFAVVVQSQSVSASIVAAPSSVSFAPPIGPAFSPEVTAIDNPACAAAPVAASSSNDSLWRFPPARIQSTTAYSFTGSPLVTPTIDGPFTGQFVDGNGTLIGAGLQNPLTFVVEKQFDAADNVYWFDPAGLMPFGYQAWQPATMTLWLDTNDDGVFQFTDLIIAGSPIISGTPGLELNGLASLPGGFSPLGASQFVYNDAEFIYDTPSKANNRYDDGEDIFYIGQFASGLALVDRGAEFRGGDHFLALDPDDPNGPPIAHIYLTQDPNYLYFHNDFLVDADSPFYDFDSIAGNDGFIDGDGTSSAGGGTPDRIGIDPAIRRWFTTTDQVAWYDADDDSHWTPSLDALWKDNGDGVYTSTNDTLIVVASGLLTDNLPASVLLNPATFEFVYSDDNGSLTWNSGEDLWGLSGDEAWDFNYFDNRIAWLIDGDGALTPNRGSDDETRIDGDQWFDADDRVYWYDANVDDEWTDGVDALWRDNNLNGTYQLGDTVLRADVAIPQNSTTNMILLQRFFVDGDGAVTNSAGSDDATRTGQAPFQFSDLIYWYDADQSKDWTSGDALWRDNGDGVYRATISDTVIISAAGFTSGTIGTALSPAAHWIGYDDGEVNYNGQYDDGEDIAASNAFFTYDDLEVDPNFKYDPGEDIYDRDYLEIWVYAEGENTSTLFDNNDFAPDREPALRDIGFRVHLNGNRVDDAAPITSTRTISDYDAPTGVQAAAGWGPSRGYVGPSFAPPDPAYGGFNRHYEYRLPRQGGQIGSAQVSIGRTQRPLPPFEKQIIEILPDCSVRITFIWKDIRRNKQGKFVGPSGEEYPKASGQKLVVTKVDHPKPVEPSEAPKKNDLNDPYLPGQDAVPSSPGTPPPFPVDSFFDVFYQNTLEQPIIQMELQHVSPLGPQTRLIGAIASDPGVIVQPIVGTSFAQVMNLPPGGWVDLSAATAVTALSIPPGTVITNTVPLTGTTPGGPLPPAPPGRDTTTFNPPATLTMTKTSTPTQIVAAGADVTYTIVAENRSPFVLRNVRLTDTLPLSMTSRGGYPIDSFFDVFVLIDLPQMLPGMRGHFEVRGTVSPTVQPGTRITNTVTGTHTSPLTWLMDTVVARKSLEVSGTVPISHPIPIEIIALELRSVEPINVGARLTTTVGPVSATLPITYHWQATDQTAFTVTTGLSTTTVFTWITPGTKTITVTASNVVSSKQVTGTLEVRWPHSLYLPINLK